MFRLLFLSFLMSSMLFGEESDVIPPFHFRNHPPVTCRMMMAKKKKKLKKHYIGILDPVQYENGRFQVYFYKRTEFDVGCYVEINKIRANKRGIYFLDRDIVRVVHLPNGGVVEPSENIISDPNYPNDPNDLLDLIDTPTPQPNDEFFDDFFDPIPEIASDGDTPTNDDYMDNPVDYANLHTEGKDETPIS